MMGTLRLTFSLRNQEKINVEVLKMEWNNVSGFLHVHSLQFRIPYFLHSATKDKPFKFEGENQN